MESARVDILWPSGVLDRYDNVAANQTLSVIEGASNALIVDLLEATLDGNDVRVRWDVSRSAGVAGFRVYRRASGGAESVISGDSLLAPSAREFVDADVARGVVYAYSVAGVETLGGESRSQSVEVVVPDTPSLRYGLDQNVPNPFNPRTEIWFDLPGASPVKLSIFAANGALVRVLSNGELPAGRHRAVWTGRDAVGKASASGVYFYRLESNFGVQTRKMVLLK
jgi:hypothetical protein